MIALCLSVLFVGAALASAMLNPPKQLRPVRIARRTDFFRER